MSPNPRLTSSRFNTSSFMTSDGCVSAKASAGARDVRARKSSPASFVDTSLEAARTSVATRKEREQQHQSKRRHDCKRLKNDNKTCKFPCAEV